MQFCPFLKNFRLRRAILENFSPAARNFRKLFVCCVRFSKIFRLRRAIIENFAPAARYYQIFEITKFEIFCFHINEK